MGALTNLMILCELGEINSVPMYATLSDKTSSNHNNYARSSNSMLHSPNDALLPLHDGRNHMITHFPGTPRAIEALRGLSNPDIDGLNLRLIGL